MWGNNGETFEGRGGPLGWVLKCRWTFSNLDCDFGTFNKHMDQIA